MTPMGSQLRSQTHFLFQYRAHEKVLRIIYSGHRGLVVIDFWAEFCGPCRRMEGQYKELARAYPDVRFLKVRVQKINNILKVVYDIPIAGHFSHRKTLAKIQDKYYWLGMDSDIKKYCMSCDLCQCSSVCGRIQQAPCAKCLL